MVHCLRIALCLAGAALGVHAAETVLTARTADYSATSRYGRLEVRAEMQGTVDFTFDGTTVVAEVYTGSLWMGAAATYTQPLPRMPLRAFRAVSIGAAKVKVLDEPGHSNRYTARIRITSKQRRLANIRLVWETDARFQGTPLTIEPGEPDNSLDGRLTLVGRFANDVELKIRGGQVLADGPFVLQRLTMSQPLPTRMLARFRKAGKLEIVDPPDANNNYTATVRVTKVKPEGEDRRIELNWRR